MNRREFVRGLVSVVFGWIGAQLTAWRVFGADAEGSVSAWCVRRVLPGDEEQLLNLMKSCVGDEDSFHGLCAGLEWTATWASGVVSDRPRSIVITLNETVVAFFDLPSREAQSVGDETLDHFGRSFWCGAAGVRMDLLGAEQSVQVFQRLLHEAFSDAMSLGYEFVRTAAPWDQHPYLPKAFREYAGLTVEPFVDKEGATKYLLEWRLADAVQTLAAAGSEKVLA